VSLARHPDSVLGGAPLAPARPAAARVSLVVPVYDEEAAVPVFLEAVERVVRDLTARCPMVAAVEVVFVDDGSRDGTVGRILAHRSEVLDVRLVKLSRNFRKDAALSEGLRHARGDAVIPMDVDLQDPPGLICDMVEAWLAGAKVVNCRRARREADGFLKRTTSRGFYRLFNRLSDHPVEPDVGDFRLLDRQVVDVVAALPERVRFMKGIFSWVGFEPVTVTYDRPERAAGETKWNWWKLWNFALDGITGASTLPLRAWTYFGFAVALAALAYAGFLVARTMVLGIDVPGYASLMVVTLFIGACNLVALGVLGEYVGRLTIEARGRPMAVVDEVLDRPRDGVWRRRTDDA
jgi:glycosyltransferase involved in cell wall biosynthesis